MTPTRFPTDLSDAELLRKLGELVAEDNARSVSILTHIAEVDERRLYLDQACSSMFAYCTEALRMSEAVAYNRIQVARAARRFPVILERVCCGEVHLAGARLLVPHLTPENHRQLLRTATHKSKRQIEAFVATLAPRPDVAPRMRKLPAPSSQPPQGQDRETEPTLALGHQKSSAPASASAAAAGGERTHRVGRPQTRLEPLSADRFKVQFTADAALHDKILEAQALLHRSHPSGDLTALFDEAVTLLLAELRRKKLGATNRPRKQQPAPPKGRHIPNAVKRAVSERDGGRCRFTAEDGRRCSATTFLEYHHVRAYARGGPATVENIELRCRSHNAHEGEHDLGFRVRSARRSSESAPACPGAGAIGPG